MKMSFDFSNHLEFPKGDQIADIRAINEKEMKRRRQSNRWPVFSPSALKMNPQEKQAHDIIPKIRLLVLTDPKLEDQLQKGLSVLS